MNNQLIGLIGTITYDTIITSSGKKIEGLGGVLYQAAALCGMNIPVSLFTNLGVKIAAAVEKVTAEWKTLNTSGIRLVPGPGNQVQLTYPPQGERIEILKSVVPPLAPEIIIPELSKFHMLTVVINSGFDLALEDWHTIRKATSCPIWLDIHSLALTKQLNIPRRYHPVEDWPLWTNEVDYIQANSTEVAALLGCPDMDVSDDQVRQFAEKTFSTGTKAVFITKGKAGVLVLTPDKNKTLGTTQAQPVSDSTGCGDVFCAGTIAKILEDQNIFDAAGFGVRLATAATGAIGIEATYKLMQTRIKALS